MLTIVMCRIQGFSIKFSFSQFITIVQIRLIW